MARYNQGGQWSLTDADDHLLFKTEEQRNAGKNEITERKKINPNSKEAERLFKALAESIVKDTPKQPTNQELFGHLVYTEEQVQKTNKKWDNVFKSHFDELKKPVKEEYSREHEGWGTGKSFNDSLTDEEKTERLKYNTD